MTKKSRYFLIAICMLAFLVLAPFVVFYVKGITYDLNGNRYLNTGLLSVRTDPKKVEIFLNDELIDTTPADLRFLKPGGYNIRLQKDGYRTWTKRTEIIGGKVSWASPGVDKIILFFETPKTLKIADGVLDFQKLHNGWLYLTSKNLYLSTDDTGAGAKSVTLSKPLKKISASWNDTMFLLTGDKNIILFNASNNTFKDISTLLKDAASYNFDSEGNLWFLKNSQLIKASLPNLQQTTYAPDVAAFYVLNNTVYYVQKNKSNLANLYLLAQVNGTLTPQNIAQVPVGKKTELAVTDQKEVFILADGDLYRINDSNQKLQTGITQWFFDSANRSLIFSTSSELGFYNFLHDDVQLIGRSAAGFQTPQLDPSLNYVFYGQDGQLIAAELDTADHQNTYTMSKFSNTDKFALDSEGKQIYLLDNGTLSTLTIR